MTEEIFNRAIVREKAIWPFFLYDTSEIESTKIIVFGLYANTYLLGHAYLESIETEELQKLVDTYNSSMAELSMHEQNLVLEIASKKYLKVIEIQIKDNALITKTRQLAADDQEYEAKLAALEVDREAVITKQSEVTLAIDRANNKINLLKAKVQLERLAQEYVALEITQKELTESRTQIKLLYAQQKALEIQLNIASIGFQIAEAEASKSGVKVGIANYKARTATTNMVTDRLDVATAQAASAVAEEAIQNVKTALVNSRGTLVSAETIDVVNLEAQEANLQEAQITEQDARHQSIVQGYSDSTALSLESANIAGRKSASDTIIAEQQKNSQITIADKHASVPPRRSIAASKAKNAAIDAAKILATADITTSLTHEIGSI